MKCAQCNKQTANPRFCSKSCAAKFNNRKFPKRAPEGKCKRCEAPLPAKKAYCGVCYPLRHLLPTTQSQKVLGPDGREVTIRLPLININRAVVFDFSTSTSTSTSTYDSNPPKTCADAMDWILSITLSKPAFLRTDYYQAFIGFALSLREDSSDRFGPASDLSIGKLNDFLQGWVYRVVHEEDWLKPHLALAFCIYVEALLTGDRGEGWKINGLMKSNNKVLQFLYDSRFRWQFSIGVSKPRIALTIPEGHSINLMIQGEDIIIPARTRIAFSVERCFLSEDWNRFSSFDTKGGSLAHDALSNALVPGQLLIEGRRERPGDIPLHWLIGASSARQDVERAAVGMKTLIDGFVRPSASVPYP